MKVEVAVLGSLSLISLMVSVDVKHHIYLLIHIFRTQVLCESRGGRHGFPVPNKSYGFGGRKATVKSFGGRKATVKRTHKHTTFYKILNSIHLLLSRQHVGVNTIISN